MSGITENNTDNGINGGMNELPYIEKRLNQPSNVASPSLIQPYEITTGITMQEYQMRQTETNILCLFFSFFICF